MSKCLTADGKHCWCYYNTQNLFCCDCGDRKDGVVQSEKEPVVRLCLLVQEWADELRQKMNTPEAKKAVKELSSPKKGLLSRFFK